jgi:hypothetical protein
VRQGKLIAKTKGFRGNEMAEFSEVERAARESTRSSQVFVTDFRSSILAAGTRRLSSVMNKFGAHVALRDPAELHDGQMSSAGEGRLT